MVFIAVFGGPFGVFLSTVAVRAGVEAVLHKGWVSPYEGEFACSAVDACFVGAAAGGCGGVVVIV